MFCIENACVYRTQVIKYKTKSVSEKKLFEAFKLHLFLKQKQAMTGFFD